MAVASQPQPVWRVCEFSEEIEQGVFDESRFGVEFYQVLEGGASTIYQDPRRFLENTYLTSEMREIVKGVLRRLSRNEGAPVYVIDTEFGGGKTHTLLLLYHLFRNRELAKEYLKDLMSEIGVLEIPEVRVVAIRMPYPDATFKSHKNLIKERLNKIDVRRRMRC